MYCNGNLLVSQSHSSRGFSSYHHCQIIGLIQVETCLDLLTQLTTNMFTSIRQSALWLADCCLSRPPLRRMPSVEIYWKRIEGYDGSPSPPTPGHNLHPAGQVLHRPDQPQQLRDIREYQQLQGAGRRHQGRVRHCTCLRFARALT